MQNISNITAKFTNTRHDVALFGTRGPIGPDEGRAPCAGDFGTAG